MRRMDLSWQTFILVSVHKPAIIQSRFAASIVVPHTSEKLKYRRAQQNQTCHNPSSEESILRDRFAEMFIKQFSASMQVFD